MVVKEDPSLAYYGSDNEFTITSIDPETKRIGFRITKGNKRGPNDHYAAYKDFNFFEGDEYFWKATDNGDPNDQWWIVENGPWYILDQGGDPEVQKGLRFYHYR